MTRTLAQTRRTAWRGAPPSGGAPRVARAWGDPAAAAGSGGHDLSRIHVSAPGAGAPIQRVRWRWDASQGRWDAVGGSSSSTSVAPTHAGRAHGEVYDDEYTQATDPTAQPYLHGGAEFFGQSGAETQLTGHEPRPDQIREDAVRGAGRSGGAGLHEVVPTNLRGWVARSGNEALIGAQSGLRTATDYQLFSPDATSTGEVGGHTGFFRNLSGAGSTHTRGQAPAHDTLRAAAETVEHEADPDVVVNTLARAHLASTPTGQQVLQSEYIEGARPNLSAFGTVGPVAPPGGTPDPARLALAQDVHARREVVKARERGRARERDPGRTRLPSPSPERTPIDAGGRGGDYVAGGRTTWATAPVPRFPGAGWQGVANATAWLTQPQRHGFDASTAPLVRPTPRTGGASTSAPLTLTPPSTTSTASLPAPSAAALLLGIPSPAAPAHLLAPASSSRAGGPTPARVVGGVRRRPAKRKQPGTTGPAAAQVARRYPQRKRQRPRTG